MHTAPTLHNLARTPLLLLLLAMLVAIPARTVHSTDLRIIYSNDIRGELEPCG